MDLHELKQKTVRDALKIDESFGNILSFVDFAMVNLEFLQNRFKK
jgi:hypothetical protein